MNDLLHKIYTKCFARYPISYKLFIELLRPEISHLIYARKDDLVIGYSMIHDNSISLLCIDPDYQNRGYGSDLLKKSEDYIKSHSQNEIILGRGNYYLLQGVPEENEDVITFFKNRGYKAEWTSVNMELLLDRFSRENLDIPSCSELIEFEFYEETKRDLLLDAVKDAEESWVPIFEDCIDPVMLAMINNEIAGFQILSPEGGRFKSSNEKVGAIGCVGVVPGARERGVGTQLVLNGIEWLKSQNCRTIELLYVELVDWYGKMGFYVTHKQWMGEKKLNYNQSP
jgi:beta-N-acetylhexosaminidase